MTKLEEITIAAEVLRRYIGVAKKSTPQHKSRDQLEAVYKRGFLDCVRVFEANLEILEKAVELANEIAEFARYRFDEDEFGRIRVTNPNGSHGGYWLSDNRPSVEMTYQPQEVQDKAKAMWEESNR